MELSDRFTQLDQLLTRHRDLWRDSPFCFPVLAWQERLPRLSAALLLLDDQQLYALENDDNERLHFFLPHLPELTTWHALLQLPVWAADISILPERWAVDVPGRKWQQISAFCAGLHDGHHLADWCAGKSHLGRALLRTNKAQQVTAIERNAQLCEDGKRYAVSQRLNLHFSCVDVMTDSVDLAAVNHVCALHACGDLHLRLLQEVTAQRVEKLTLAPCCYHLTATTLYKPLSQFGSRSSLQLSTGLMHLAVEETVTSGARMRRQRNEMMSWRLAFDRLQRELRSCNDYLATPSRPYSILHNGFAAFIADMCQHHALPMPAQWNQTDLLEYGRLRWQQVQRLQLLRHLFRRPLELWLVTDRALWLQEQHYQVALHEFCPRELTPRNIVINANRIAYEH